MKFNDTQPIFLQIADYVCDMILRDHLTADMSVPSIRELAVNLEVNPNTVMRAFERLSANEIVYNKRGIGYFVTAGANEKIFVQRRKRLFDDVLPGIFEEMKLLNVSDDDFLRLRKEYEEKFADEKIIRTT